MSGDRKFAEDEMLVGGFGRFRGDSICVIGHEKGATTETRLRHNFGMARPEGYRKAVRLMEMADRFAIPVLALVDTAGAYPGIGAEERGQAEASPFDGNLSQSTRAKCGGGARRRRVGRRDCDCDRQPRAMLEHAIYSVISPEGAPPSCGETPARRRKRPRT